MARRAAQGSAGDEDTVFRDSVNASRMFRISAGEGKGQPQVPGFSSSSSAGPS